MRLFKLILIGLAFVHLTIFAVESDPLTMMTQITNKMLEELDRNLGQIKKDEKLVYNMVNRILIPHFDLEHMSKSVIGREHWQTATFKVQRQFIEEFTYYITSTYSSALKSYDGEKMKFYPLRGQITDRVKISSDLLLKNGSSIRLQYSLLKGNTKWLIYDFSVDGVSIVKNYNSQFMSTLRQHGLDGLVKELRQRNIK